MTGLFGAGGRRVVRELRADLEATRRELSVLQARVEALTASVEEQRAALADRPDAPGRRHGAPGQGPGATVRRAGPPIESDMAVFDLAQRYAVFVEHVAMDLAEQLCAARVQPPDDMAEAEADDVARIVGALVLGRTDDGTVLTQAAEREGGLRDGLARAREAGVELRAAMSEHGARLRDTVEPGSASHRHHRLVVGCHPGPVDRVVAPALVVGDVVVCDHSGRPAGPWVLTTNRPR